MTRKPLWCCEYPHPDSFHLQTYENPDRMNSVYSNDLATSHCYQVKVSHPFTPCLHLQRHPSFIRKRLNHPCNVCLRPAQTEPSQSASSQTMHVNCPLQRLGGQVWQWLGLRRCGLRFDSNLSDAAPVLARGETTGLNGCISGPDLWAVARQRFRGDWDCGWNKWVFLTFGVGCDLVGYQTRWFDLALSEISTPMYNVM